jgi:hypothetical protein
MSIRIVLAGALAASLVSVTPSLADGKSDYMAACMGASNNNTELCTCKTDEAVKIADEEMLGFIVIALKDNAKFREMVQKGEVPDAVVKKWPTYVRESNKVCIPPAS